ncbi:MAG: ribonuclease H-like domain-containing protein [Planctomycetaceae bacterium]|nr:ribonuclease H-like domain-containing protein [Planctomycetaceae bacterium]
MITEALQHIRGIGPARLQKLREDGVRSWHDVVGSPDRLPKPLRSELVDECQRSIDAHSRSDISYFVDRLHPRDRWRILHEFFDQASWFDIETTGLGFDDQITVIVCWHRNQLHTFVEDENLDDFLDLLDDVRLLVSFNGSTFDVPKLLDGFHIPDLPCPHIDLRWPCHYRSLQGGLKQISGRIGIRRPDDLLHADGDLAVQLWSSWKSTGNQNARRQLLRYCAMDVLLLLPLTAYVADRPYTQPDDFWHQLPAAAPIPDDVVADAQRRTLMAHMFGNASPTQLRMRRPRR